MKKIFWSTGFTSIIILFVCVQGFPQINQDSLLLANSEQWKVEQHKGLFGLSKPAFNKYITTGVFKIDSGFRKTRKRDSASLDFSNENQRLDHNKYMTIQKIKFYKLQLAGNNDTTNAEFSIASISKERRQTLLGKLMSKNGEESRDESLSYQRDVPGTITTGKNSMQWEFLINNFTSGSRQTTHSFGAASISSGYLQNKNDSLYMQIYSSFAADLIMVNRNDEHIAALKFKQKPLSAWIRHDIDDNLQEAIAGLFAVILSIKDF